MKRFINSLVKLQEQSRLSKVQLSLAVFGIFLFLTVLVTLPILNSQRQYISNISASGSKHRVPTPTPTPVLQSSCPSGSTMITGGDLAASISSLPSGGTLCLNGGSYSVSAQITLSKPMTLYGVSNPQITTSGSGFDITSPNVTLQGIGMKGTADNRTGAGSSCSGPAAIRIEAIANSNINILNNTINYYECGIVLSGTDTFKINGNNLLNIVYSGITTFPASNGTFDGNTVTDVDTTGPLRENAYGLVASGPAGTPSFNLTFTHNAVFNAPTWECFDNHGGNNIQWRYNYCLAGGSGNSAMNMPGNGQNPENNGVVDDNQIDRGVSQLPFDSIVMVAGNGGGLTGGEVMNNLIAMDGTHCYSTIDASVTQSGNTCNHNPAQITSIAVSNSSFLHGQPNAVIGQINVNMSLPFPSWMNSTYGFPNGWPGSLAITGSNPGGFQILNGQLLQAPGGTPAGSYNVTIVAALHGLKNSPQQTTITLTGS
jgi:hypothetical protein